MEEAPPEPSTVVSTGFFLAAGPLCATAARPAMLLDSGEHSALSSQSSAVPGPRAS